MADYREPIVAFVMEDGETSDWVLAMYSPAADDDDGGLDLPKREPARLVRVQLGRPCTNGSSLYESDFACGLWAYVDQETP